MDRQLLMDAGIDAESAQNRVRLALDGCWNRGVALMEDGEPTDAARVVLDDPELGAYTSWLVDQEISLLEEIRETVKAANPETFIWHFVAIIARSTVSGVEVTGGVEGRNIPTTTPVHT